MGYKSKIFLAMIVLVVGFLTARFVLERPSNNIKPEDTSAVNQKGLTVEETSQVSTRVALVVGNAKYTKMPLTNTINDAQDMRVALEELGFDVQLQLDVNDAEMAKMLDQWEPKVKNRDAVFYFSGHGVQIDGVNYLLPINVDNSSKLRLIKTSLEADWILEKMQSAKTKILILDACRDNPCNKTNTLGKSIATGRGLAEMRKSDLGTVIIFATGPGAISLDQGTNLRNGMFTESLLNHIKTPNISIADCMTRITNDVADNSRKQQIPWYHTSLTEPFYFNLVPTTPTKIPQPTQTTPAYTGTNQRPLPSNSTITTGIVIAEKMEIELELKPLQQGEKNRYEVMVYNRGATGNLIVELIFPIGMVSKQQPIKVQWPEFEIQTNETKTLTHQEYITAIQPGQYTLECKAQEGSQILCQTTQTMELTENEFPEIIARKKAEEARKIGEAQRKADEARRAEETRRAEEARKAQAEAQRKADEARRAEEARKAQAEAQRKADEARRAEEARKAQAEAQRKADEARRLAEEASRNQFRGFTYLREATYSCGGITNKVKEYLHNQTGLEFVLIPGGTFNMGSNDGDSDEKPVHQVTLSPYLISKTEVTQLVWQKVMGSNPSRFKGDNHPVECVDWNDCQEFCQKTGLALPTEAQWEYAARGGNSGKWCCGNDENELSEYAWYGVSSSGVHHEVGKKSPNAYGIYDLHGNVGEWVQDVYGPYPSESQNNPTGIQSGSDRVYRGGGWDCTAAYLRSADRRRSGPGNCGRYLGFRVVPALP